MGLIPGIGMLSLKPKANGVKKVENATLAKTFSHGMNNCNSIVFTPTGGWMYIWDDTEKAIKEYNGGYFDIGSSYLSATYPYNILGGSCYSMAGVLSRWDFYFATDYYIKEDQGMYTTISLSSYANNVGALWVMADGTKLYYIANGILYQCNMTTAHYVNTRTEVKNKALTAISSTIAFAYSLYVSPDGTQILIGNYVGGKLYQLLLSTPFDIATATLYSTLTIPSTVSGINMKPDGSKMFLLYQDGNLKQYTMN